MPQRGDATLQHQELEQTSDHESLILHASDVKAVSLFHVISFSFFYIKVAFTVKQNCKVVDCNRKKSEFVS